MHIGPKNRLDDGGALPMTRRIATAIPLQAQGMIAQDRMKV
jgi:hypothetical protein